MPLIIVRNDITKMNVEAIVNPTNQNLIGVSGIDKLIHDIEKENLTKQLESYTNCNMTDVIITTTSNISSKYIYHVINPMYIDGTHNEEDILRKCYINILNKAVENEIDSIAIPLLSTGNYGFPKDKGIAICKSVVEEYAKNTDLTIYVVLYDEESFITSKKYFNEVLEFMNQLQKE